jgi:CheY-like chemotaxis protein
VQPQFEVKKRRIAVIDDDAIFVELMHDLLGNGEGYDVVSTSHWPLGVEFIKETRPDLVILDLMMGREQTGWAVLDLLQDDPETAAIPVILCSAAAPALTQCACRPDRRGRVEAVAKPFDVDDLLGVIERLLAADDRIAIQATARPTGCA